MRPGEILWLLIGVVASPGAHDEWLVIISVHGLLQTLLYRPARGNRCWNTIISLSDA